MLKLENCMLNAYQPVSSETFLYSLVSDCHNNLSDFISMDEKVGIGTVLTATQLLHKLS